MRDGIIDLDEVPEKIKSMSDDHEPYSNKWLKTKLQQRFGDHLVFSEMRGKKNVPSFKDMVNYIINKKWYDERINNVEKEAIRIITTAAKLIQQEIKNIDLGTEYYPTTQIKESAQQNKWCSPLLRMFLCKVVPNEIKQAAVGQCIIKSARLIDELFKVGFSVSYSEVNRFKQSIVQTEESNYPKVLAYPGMFTQ